jgi:hypothetical protein
MNSTLNNKKDNIFKISLILLLLFSFGYIYYLTRTLRNDIVQNRIDEQNYQASIDSLHKHYNKKISEYQTTTSSFIGQLSDLKTYNENLFNKLNKIDGNILAAIQTSIGVIVGEVKNNQTIVNQVNDSIYISNMIYSVSDEGFSQTLHIKDSLKVLPYYIKTRINDIDTILVRNNISSLGTLYGPNSINLDLTLGFSEEKNRYKVWITSPSSYINVNDLVGYYKYYPKKSNPWVFGPTLGYGLLYNTRDGVMKPGFYIGLGVTYKFTDFYNFKFNKVKVDLDDNKLKSIKIVR